eukprot:1046133-Prymnesium_polylepis.1
MPSDERHREGVVPSADAPPPATDASAAALPASSAARLSAPRPVPPRAVASPSLPVWSSASGRRSSSRATHATPPAAHAVSSRTAHTPAGRRSAAFRAAVDVPPAPALPSKSARPPGLSRRASSCGRTGAHGAHGALRRTLVVVRTESGQRGGVA